MIWVNEVFCDFYDWVSFDFSLRTVAFLGFVLDDILFIIKELRSLGDNRLERRIRQLTVDYLQKTWTQTHSLRELHSRVSELRKEGFLPLPLRCYSLRYLAASLVF